MARYSEEIIDEVRQSNDIVDVISQYMYLKRSGRNYFGLCPFHNEKSPSFSVSPDKQIFHCFGCGVGGNVISFIMKIEGCGFVEAIQILAEKANIQLPTLENNVDSQREELKAKVYKVNEITADFYHKNLYTSNAKIGQEYVKKRMLTNDTLENYKIGFSGKFNELYTALKRNGFGDQEILESGLVNRNDNGQYIDRYRNRLMFPICDVRGRVIAFGGRVLDDSKPKYINSPENVVYSKGRHLFGLNVAKKYDTKQLLIVEGYMDVISLHQRGVKNVVGALGTALTQQQGFLLRKNAEQVILSFDSDEAGQTAKIRAIDVLQNMGLDLRVLQMEGAKDPDEYIIKYGNARFKNVVDRAISVLEFKIKILKNKLNLDNINDKIKFLNEIAKLLSNIDNTMEREIYIEKISDTYQISKEAIYAEVNKLSYAKNQNEKILDKKKTVVVHRKQEVSQVSQTLQKRENMILSILLTGNMDLYQVIKINVNCDEFKDELNKKIAKKLYEEFEKGNSNINAILDKMNDEEQSHITEIMADDYGIDDMEKAIDDIIQSYQRDKLNDRKMQILTLLDEQLEGNEKKNLESELIGIVNQLAKMK